VDGGPLTLARRVKSRHGPPRYRSQCRGWRTCSSARVYVYMHNHISQNKTAAFISSVSVLSDDTGSLIPFAKQSTLLPPVSHKLRRQVRHAPPSPLKSSSGASASTSAASPPWGRCRTHRPKPRRSATNQRREIPTRCDIRPRRISL
jgi:hypothetical protein